MGYLSHYQIFRLTKAITMKRIFFFGTVLLMTLPSLAQRKALLWEISGNGLTTPSFLYGTIHLICAQDFVISGAVKNSFQTTAQVVLELDMDDPKMMLDMAQYMFMKNGMTLKKLYSESDYNDLDHFFKDSLGMGLGLLNGVKPFILMSMMYKSVLKCEPKSYEMTFVEMAKKQKKEVMGLESVQEQMAIFDEIPYETQATALIKMIREGMQTDDEFDKIVKLYKSQNIKRMANTANTNEFEFSGFEDKLLADRNTSWINKIGTFAHQKSTFFAVGAAHLGGRKGVIRLLKKAGYKLKAIRQL